MPELSARLREWLSAQLASPGPFEVTPIGGGHSNETSRLTSPDGQWILRRPPARAISVSANNLAREHRILTSLGATDVPAPQAVAFAEAGEVTDYAVLVMSVAPGYPLTDEWPADWPEPVSIGAVGSAAIDALAALHNVDYRQVGLADFGRPAGYLTRQVARWRGQYEQHKVRELPLFDVLGHWLERNQPAEQRPAILHGDFHLDNCLVLPGPPTRMSAIIDWELATIGDPLVDLGLLLAFWGDDRAQPVSMPKVQALTRTPSSPGRAELADRYTALTGRSSHALDWYMTLALFKLAAIVEGAYARFVSGASDDPWDRSLGEDVPRLLEDAARHAL